MSNAKPERIDGIVAQAGAAWLSGNRLDAGRLLIETMPEESRPKWAASLLNDLIERSGVWHVAVATMLYVAGHPDQWEDAHSVFSMIRKIGLGLDRIQPETQQQKLLMLVLGFGELVAKVTHNATRPPDPFDIEAGWSIAACYKAVLDVVIGDDSSQLAWDILSAKSQLLEGPIS